jgi:hypothetical protein
MGTSPTRTRAGRHFHRAPRDIWIRISSARCSVSFALGQVASSQVVDVIERIEAVELEPSVIGHDVMADARVTSGRLTCYGPFVPDERLGRRAKWRLTPPAT